MAHEDEQTRSEFVDGVIMTASELERWLDNDEWKALGQKDGESTGHTSGRRIADILRKKNDELTDTDLAHMRKGIGYVHRHLARRPAGDVSETP